jgi:parallel beta-helix repeat protein
MIAALAVIIPSRAVTQPQCSGVQVYPGSDIQAAISANPAGTTFCINDGLYDLHATLRPKIGDRFFGVWNDLTRPRIQNLVSGIVIDGRKQLWLQGLQIGPSHSAGLRPGTDSTVIGNRITGNETCGIITAANNMTILDNEIDHNGLLVNKGGACGVKLVGYEGADSGAYNTLIGNNVHDNIGNGLWADCDAHDNVFDSNTVTNNDGVGLDQETAYGNTFSNNVVTGNGFEWGSYAMQSLDSIGGSFTGNTFTDNYKGVNVWRDERGTLTTPQPGLGCAGVDLEAYVPAGTSVDHNTFTASPRAGFGGTVTLQAATFDYNAWCGATGTNWRLPSDPMATWDQWIRAGQDTHGTILCPS